MVNILAAATQQGLPRDILLDATGLRDVDLRNPDTRVPSWAYVALWHLIARHAPDAGVAIRMGAAVPVRQWGLVGYAMAYSATLGTALRRLSRYQDLLNQAQQFGLEEAADRHVAIKLRGLDLGVGLSYEIGFRFTALLAGCRQVTRAELVPAEVAFAYDRPGSTLEYNRFFRCALRFSQPESNLVLGRRDLDLPISGGDETLAGYLSENAERVLGTLCTGTSTRERVRSAIWAALSEGPPTLRHVAATLHMPPRTLQRHLAADGTSLHREIERIRERMAKAALAERTAPIEEVAFILGYTEPSTFYRSFKRWTGKTPRQYRAAAA